MARKIRVVAVDTGGTFTDFVVLAGDGFRVLKVPSTPTDPSRAVLDGLARVLAGAGARSCDVLIHGSTVATNALLERRGARVVLVATAGFEDVVELGRQTRPALYALEGRRPAPLVAAADRLGLAGRIGPDGAVQEVLDAAGLRALADRLAELDCGVVAVALLHGYANPAHEAAVAGALRQAGHAVSVATELLPEYREYERTCVAVLNAYVTPKMAGYLSHIEEEAPAARIRLMGSNGGALGLARAREGAVHTILSGPAGGVAGAVAVGRRHGLDQLMTVDMGGTSTDVSLCPGGPVRTRELVAGGVPVALPMLDIHTVGAGGGSLARLDAGGALRVGPDSAGADPGPVCAGRGGTALTVTDANVALGRLPADTAGLGLDAALLTKPLAELAEAMGCTPAQAAEGIVAVVDTAMEGALRVISVEKGHDPRDFVLVPFGGAAGLHALSLAERLDMRRVLLPPHPGVLSAWGMLAAAVRKDVTRSLLVPGDAPGGLEPTFVELERQALDELEPDGVAPGDATLRRWVAARYEGQSHELEVPADDWQRRFHAAHRQRFGYHLPSDVEAVTLGVEALGPEPVLPVPSLADAKDPAAPGGQCVVRHRGADLTAARFDRENLRTGHRIEGPALVLEETATFWLSPGWSAAVLGDGCILATRDG
jgi:N-methylhydantoinase A